jgi:hypothetical protein
LEITDQTYKDFHGGGFSSAVGTNVPENLPFFYPQRYIVQRAETTESFRHISKNNKFLAIVKTVARHISITQTTLTWKVTFIIFT